MQILQKNTSKTVACRGGVSSWCCPFTDYAINLTTLWKTHRRFFCAIWIIVNGEEFIEQINHIDYISVGKDIGILYCLFMLVYLLITWMIYAIRYSKEKKEYQKYGESLKKIHRMYVRDDKLKM